MALGCMIRCVNFTFFWGHQASLGASSLASDTVYEGGEPATVTAVSFGAQFRFR